MKTIITSCALAVTLLALNLQAQTNNGWRGANNPSNPVWNLPGNWALGHVPIMAPAPGDKADFNNRDQPPCFVNSAVAPSQFVTGDGNPTVTVIVNGGSLITSNYAGVNSANVVSWNHFSRLELQNGGSLISSNHLWVGLNNNARGTFVMNGGTATVLGMFGLGWNGGIGTVLVNGGTLNLAQWDDINSIKQYSQLDIRAGSMIISNDHTASIANYVASGQVTGYGGVGAVHYSYDTNSLCTTVTATAAPGAGGPYPVSDWPTNINPNLMAHYWTVDGSLGAPNANWFNSLGLVLGGDQTTVDVNFQGLPGKQATTANINIFDQNWQDWNTNGLIDILLCVYGDANVLRSAADPYQGRRFQFLTGTLPTDSFSTVYGGLFATNAYNSKWNWLMFTITNNFQSNMVDRLVGSLRTNLVGTATYGGINGGTIRIQGPDNNVNNLSIRAAAFGQHGVFGTVADINQFAPASGACPPVLDVNLAAVDYNAGYTNHLQVINDPATSQDVSFANNIGPANDKRKAVIPNSYYLNFGIVSNYLGQPCNDNGSMKVCVDYYDDPAFAGMGVQFGPQNYANDSLGDISSLPGTFLVTLQGSGQWIRQSWIIPGVNLSGVSTAPLTGGPQFVSIGGQVPVSRFYLAALRSTGPLAGQDPLADCYPDPNICFGIYGNYAELDLANGITDGLDLGTSSGDQTYVVETAGPPTDQRLSVRPDFAPAYSLNFQILTNALGPTTQGNVHLAITVTYYDDPALTGQGFRPQVWKSQQALGTSFSFMNAPQNIVLQGTGKWRDAYWEIGSISFDGVNQGPQAAARFECDSPIHISRVRYSVIRPCGPTAGQNLLSNPVVLTAAPDTNSLVRLSWPYRAPQAILQGANGLGGGWLPITGTPVVEGGEQAVFRAVGNTTNAQFFRLTLPPQ